MKKPKSKLDKAKDNFIDHWSLRVWEGDFRDSPRVLRKAIRRQLNNLIRLAREEGRKKNG